MPPKSDVVIDIPVYDQSPVKNEVLVQLKEEHVRNPNGKQYQEIVAIPADELAIIRKNGVSVLGQKRIIDILMEEIPEKLDRFQWSTQRFPKYHQLQKVLILAWNNLIVDGETTRPMTLDVLVGFTIAYLSHHDESYLIKRQFDYFSKRKEFETKPENEIYDAAIQFVFQTIRHWMQYKVPKWLSVISELQKFVCEKKGLEPGDYTGIANLIENGFIPDNLSIMLEYGVPASAVRKIRNKLPNDISQDDVWEYIQSNEIANEELLSKYEIEKITQNFV